MKKNMGGFDRIFRVVVAIVIGVLYQQGIIEGTLGIVLLAVSGVFILTSFISFCPLYSVFGIKTNKDK